MKRTIILLSVLGSALMLAACGGGAPATEVLLLQAADAMGEVETLQFVLERTGEAVMIDPDTGLSMLGANGVYRAPDSVYAVVTGEVMNMVVEAEVLWLADGIYFKLPPLLPDFTPIDLEATFDAANIFAADTGLPYVLTKELQGLKLVGEETIEEFNTYHITAQAEGQKLNTLVGPIVLSDMATVDVWIDKATGNVVRFQITEDDESGWLLDFFAFDEPVEIPSP